MLNMITTLAHWCLCCRYPMVFYNKVSLIKDMHVQLSFLPFWILY